MPSVEDFVDGKLKGKKVVVFSKSFCPYCKKAKEVFKNYLGKDLSPEDYEVIEIDDNPDCDAIQNYLQKLTGGRSVPRVFVDGKFIGGGDDVVALHKDSKLKDLLK